MSEPKGRYSRSIFATILIPLIILLVAEIAIFGSILFASGAVERLEQNDRDIMNQQIASRRDVIENYLVGTVGNLDDLAASINGAAAKLIAGGSLRVEAIGNDVAASAQLQSHIVADMVDALRDKQVSGVFVVFNTRDLSGMHDYGAYGRLPGLYVSDMDPAATPSARNEDLVIETGSPEILQSYQITTDSEWMPVFDLDRYPGTDEYEFFYRTFQTAFEAQDPKRATDFAYWGTAPRLGAGVGDHCMTYTIPLILDDGTVYGVLGVDLSADYLQTLLPSQEILGNTGASYALALVPEGTEMGLADSAVQARCTVFSGSPVADLAEFGAVVDLDVIAEGQYEFSAGQTFYAGCEPLRLYNTNSPVEDYQWVLMGMIPTATLHQFSSQVRWMIVWASLLMLLVGVLGSILIGRSISSPVKALSQELSDVQARMHSTRIPDLPRTGISEIDQLTSAITSLSGDIESVKILEQRMEYERDFDLLTGVMNRRAFYREAGKVFAEPMKLKHAAIVMIDIDNLKDINDAYGHDWGDKYVHASSRCFEDNVPEGAILGRVSGDEFYVLLYGYDTPEELNGCIENLRQSIRSTEFVFPDGKVDHINVSGGIALYLRDAEEFAELMRLADFAMYQVKSSGKDNFAYFDLHTYQQETQIGLQIEELRGILHDFNLVSYHFQPIFDAHSGRPYAYEALMRVSLDALKSPLDVLNCARREKRLVEVERLTWVRSLECYQRLLDVGQANDDAYLFINTFPNISLSADELAELARENSRIMPKVVIEVTEAENLDEEALDTKRSMPGFSGLLALDDYGSGYNSELMLLTLSPRFVKVDISIIRDIDTSVDKQRLVSQVVEYAHERDMLIVAEGVETAAELKMAVSLGVDLLQGYFLAKPAAVPEHINPEALDLLLSQAD